MAGTVADYVVITDAELDLKLGADSDEDFDFEIPPTAAVAQRAILALMVNSAGSANDLKSEVSINGIKVFTYGPTDANLTRPFHEIVSGNVLRIGANNIKIRVVSGKGTFRVSDILIWFQNNV